MTPDQSSVVYRETFTELDYNDAIRALQAAKKQKGKEHHGCTVCWSSGHTADFCHHNPLVMARRAVILETSWRCFYCNEMFTDAKEAAIHFGIRKNSRPLCTKIKGKAQK